MPFLKFKTTIFSHISSFVIDRQHNYHGSKNKASFCWPLRKKEFSIQIKSSRSHHKGPSFFFLLVDKTPQADLLILSSSQISRINQSNQSAKLSPCVYKHSANIGLRLVSENHHQHHLQDMTSQRQQSQIQDRG